MTGKVKTPLQKLRDNELSKVRQRIRLRVEHDSHLAKGKTLEDGEPENISGDAYKIVNLILKFTSKNGTPGLAELRSAVHRAMAEKEVMFARDAGIKCTALRALGYRR